MAEPSSTFPQKVDQALAKMKKKTDWKCTGCSNGQKKLATKSCLTCVINLCDNCAGKQTAETAGARIKEKYRIKFDSINSSAVESRVAKSMESLHDQSKYLDKTFKDFINKTKQKLNDLLKQVDDVEKKVGKQLTDNLEILDKMSRDLKDYTGAKDKLKDHLTYLINQASDPEVVGSEKDLPVYDITTYKQTLQRSSIDLPDFTTKFRDIQTQLDKCQQDLDINHVIEGISDKPVTSLTKTNSFTVGNWVWGLAVDSARERVIVRRRDATAPVTVYDFQGNKKQVLGKGVDGMTSHYYQSIAIDTKRDLLILPAASGYLVTMDMNGEVVDRIKVADKYLCAAAYSGEDLYVTSTNGPHQVYLINAETKQTVVTFKPENHTKFNQPLNVCCCQFTHEGETKPVVIVSDCSNYCIKVLDLTGKLLHVYGKEGKLGQGEGEFNHLWGVCTDPAGRIIVGDGVNTRVVSVWSEGNQDKWLQLLDKSKLTNNGYLVVTFDAVSRKLFVMYSNNTELQVYSG